MNKLCLIFNIASHYRKNIYQLIDNTFDCDWFFGENDTDIKSMDLSLLKRVTTGKNIKLFKRKAIYWQEGVFNFVRKQKARTYLILGEPICLSTWILFVKLKLSPTSSYVYTWTHGWYGRESWIKKIIKKIFFNMTDGVFLYGNYAKQLMIQEGFDPQKLHVVHNSLDYEKQLLLRQSLKSDNLYQDHFNNSNRTLLFIGRLTNKKRLDMLIESISILRDRGEYYNLVLIGKGEAMEQLKLLVEEKDLKENVWFYGECYDEATNANLIFNADLCVSPGFVGLTAMHSMMFGTPVATHNCFKLQAPEFEAIKEGVTGTYFEMNQLDSIINTISNWFKMNEKRREEIRLKCFEEIDREWTPTYQLNVFKQHIRF